MKSTLKIMFVILAVAVTFVAVQSVGAVSGNDTFTAAGTIDSISEKPNMVVVADTEIYGIKFDYLCNQYTICLQDGEIVSIEYFEFLCDDGTVKAMASSITVGDVTVQLR